MTESPEQIATRLMAPASASALWTYDQVRALIIEAVKAGADNQDGPRAPSATDAPAAKS